MHGRKDAGQRRGRQQHVAEQLDGFLIPAGGGDRDLAHVPDHLALGIEIGRADHEHPAVAILVGNLAEHPAVDVLGDQIAQRRGVRERLGAEQAGQRPAAWPPHSASNVVHSSASWPVVAGSEKGVGGDQCACAHAGDDLEFRAVAALRPAHEQACAECAVIGAAGQGQVLDERPALVLRGRPGRHALDARHVRLHEGVDLLGHLVAPEADVGEAGHGGLRDQGCRHGAGARRARSHHGGGRDQARSKDATYTPTTQLRTPVRRSGSGANIPYSSNFRTIVLTDAATREKPCSWGHRVAARGHPLAQISVSFFDDGGAELPGPGCALLAGGPCRGDLPVGACSGAVPVPERRQDVAVHTLTR